MVYGHVLFYEQIDIHRISLQLSLLSFYIENNIVPAVSSDCDSFVIRICSTAFLSTDHDDEATRVPDSRSD